ncbi:hypothetical protein GEV43_29595 [Actinomadura sp. J1-007]|nr:hypothetical protein [Actinomadura sp. J1-007]
MLVPECSYPTWMPNQRLMQRISAYRAATKRSIPGSWLGISWRTLIFVGSLLAFLVLFILYAPMILYPSISDVEFKREKVIGEERIQIENDRIKLQNETRSTLLQGVAGAAVILGAYFTARQVQASRATHTTDQFIRAVEQMGRPDRTTETTLGGIYGLERVARESAVDRRSIAEILAAFICYSSMDSAKDLADAHSLREYFPERQAAITVLARGESSDLNLYRERDIRVIDLSGADLRKVDIYDLTLSAVNLNSANLEGAFIAGANFSYTDFGSANMGRIIANNTDFSGAWFHSANCKSGNFYNANFMDAILQDADFANARMKSANFTGCYLGELISKVPICRTRYFKEPIFKERRPVNLLDGP